MKQTAATKLSFGLMKQTKKIIYFKFKFLYMFIVSVNISLSLSIFLFTFDHFIRINRFNFL